MGGKAFATAKEGQPALYVPRMEPEVYFPLKSSLVDRMRPLFRLVECPKEAPEKDSYGDVDVVVAGPNEAELRRVWERLPAGRRLDISHPSGAEVRFDVVKNLLDSKREMRNSNTWTFAVPHPTESDAYVQVDVNEQSSEMFEWHVCHHSYGDFWSIMGTALRAHGLTIHEEGLFVRDPDIENLNRKRARVLLSRSPLHVVSSMGFDYAEWCKGWSTELGMFTYIARSQYFMPELYVKGREMTAIERKRLRSRPCYARFVQEFAAKCIADSSPKKVLEEAEEEAEQVEAGVAVAASEKSTPADVDRAAVRADVLRLFNVSQVYDDNHRKWVDEQDVLSKKRFEKAVRRGMHVEVQKSYAQHWIDWFLNSLDDTSRRLLDLDLDKGVTAHKGVRKCISTIES